MIGINAIKINICATYRQPITSNYEMFYNELNKILSNFPNTILIGDVNVNLLDNSDVHVINYQSIIDSNNFTILNKIQPNFYTRSEAGATSILDHAVTDLHNKFTFDFIIGESGVADHRFLLIGLNDLNNSSEIPENPVEVKKIRKISWSKISKNLEKLPQSNFSEFHSNLRNLIEVNTKILSDSQIIAKKTKNHGLWKN